MENQLGYRFRQIATLKGLSISAFSDRIGVSNSALHAVVTGRTKPSFDMVSKVADSFPDISMEWLIRNDSAMIRSATTSDPACWDLLKREEEQHKVLRADYDELKNQLRKSRLEYIVLLNKLAHYEDNAEPDIV